MSNENNPWGQGGRSSSNIDEMLDQISNKLTSVFKNNGPVWEYKGMILMVTAVLIGLLAYISVYQVQPGERAVILRFGVHERTDSPGLNFLIPLIEKMIIVNIEQVNKLEFGFRQTSNEVPKYRNTVGNQRNIEALMLTGDKNVIQFNWMVQYRIDNPVDYLFKVHNPEASIRDFSESVIRRLVGNRAFDNILDKRIELATASQQELQELLNKYQVGVKIDTVQLLDVNPPDEVKGAFNEVNQADQDKRRLANEAQKLYNEKIYKARGEAEQVIEESKGYAARRINTANGDVSRFLSIYSEYKQSKDVTRQRMFVETMNEILPQAKEIIIIDASQQILPLMNFGFLNKEAK